MAVQGNIEAEAAERRKREEKRLAEEAAALAVRAFTPPATSRDSHASHEVHGGVVLWHLAREM